MLQSVEECYRVSQGVTECYRVLESISSASTWTNFWACSTVPGSDAAEGSLDQLGRWRLPANGRGI